MTTQTFPEIPDQDVSNTQFFILGLLVEGAKSIGKLREIIKKDVHSFCPSQSVGTTLTVYLKRFEEQGTIFSIEFDDGNRIYQLTRKGFQKWADQFDYSESLVKLWKEKRVSCSPQQFLDVERSQIAPAKAKEPVIERAPTPVEQQTILGAAPPDFRLIYEFSLLTKIRAPDLANAQIENIYWDKNLLLLEEISASGRTIENREVRLDKDSKAILTSAIKDRDRGAIFKRLNGRNWDPNALSRIFRNTARKTGIPREVALSGRGGKIGRITEEEDSE